MHRVCDASIELVVTAPPMWNSVEDADAGGTYENYVNTLNLTWSACMRVLREGCRLCVCAGDHFIRQNEYGRFKAVSPRTEIVRFCEAIGFDFMGSIVCQRFTPQRTSAGTFIAGSYPYPRNGIIKLDCAHILVFRKPGEAPPITKEMKDASRMTRKEWTTFFNGHWYLRESHHTSLTQMPAAIPDRLIRMFSFAGETVLDPFGTDGTTATVAAQLGRQSVSYRPTRAGVSEVENRVLEFNLLDSPLTVSVQTERRELRNGLSEALAKLPYIYRDPVIKTTPPHKSKSDNDNSNDTTES
ncbi:MAG: site-specific DNA-methyltransferase [Candidatus Sumerlaeales bacterium]|nr:site-specific DNA-methyltransferase [Candidatus Sumerlaeales bacterium]